MLATIERVILLLALALPGTAVSSEPPPLAQKPGVPKVELLRVPEGGIQPQAVVGGDGSIHLLYFRGEAKGGDLFYVQRAPGSTQWCQPRRVNSQPRSATAVGNNRGGQIALGRNGIVHVVWNGSDTALPAGPDKSSPMLYTRWVPGTDFFTPQRNVMVASKELDGGGSVAADAKGNVYVVWHGVPLLAVEANEAARRVFVAVATDDGATFAPELARSDASCGVCACCGLKASVLPSSDLLVLYRAAGQNVNRDMRLLRSGDSGKTYAETKVEAWDIDACPMSTASITPAPLGAALAWETKGDVRWGSVPASGATATSTAPIAIHTVSGRVDARKYPSLAANVNGYVLLAWAEGMSWNGGGRLRWQLFDAQGSPLGDAKNGADGVPAWSLVSAVATPSGGFLILY